LALLNFEWVIFSNIYPGGETYLTRNRMAACQESALFVMAVAAQKPRPQPFPMLISPCAASRVRFAEPQKARFALDPVPGLFGREIDARTPHLPTQISKEAYCFYCQFFAK
jgi:hypothetical protein